MADDQISVKIVVDASQAKDGFKQVEDQAKEMGDAVRTAGARAGEGLKKPLEISQQQMRAAIAAAGGDVNKALKSLATLGDESAKAGEKILSNSKGLAASLQQLGGTLAANLQNDARHIIAIFDEAMRGQRGAMIASISALGRDLGALDMAIKGVGATATWFVTSPMGLVAAGIAGIVATIAAAIGQLMHLDAEMRRVGAEALAMGRQPTVAVESYKKLKEAVPSAADEEIAQAIERIQSLSEKARMAIAKIAPAMIEAQYGGNIEQFAKHVPAVFGSSAEMTALVEKNRLLGGEQLAKFLGAARDQQAEMLAQALATRYGPFQAQLKAQQDVGAAMAAGLAGIMPPTVPKTLPTTAIPAARASMPSQADIDAIEAIRKASPHHMLVEQLQQQIATIQAGMAALTPSLQDQARAAIEKLQEQITKLQSLPGYQAGGVVPADQAAQLHAGEMVLPANISSGLQNLITIGQSGAAPTLTQAVTSLGQSAANLATSSSGLDRAAQELGSSLAAGLADLWTGRSFARSMQTFLRDELRATLRDALGGLFKGLSGSMFGGALGPNFSVAGLSQGLGSLLGGGIRSAFGAAIGNPFASAAGSGLLGGVLGNPFAAGSAGLLGGSLGGVGSWISGLFGAAAPLAWIEKGGIVPSAARGWVVPSFAEGGILSMLHKNEMVLPAHISQFVQDAAARGGGGHTFNLNISAMDGASVMRAGPALVASINRAMRHGAGVGYNSR